MTQADWYYHLHNEQHGPVSRASLDALLAEQVIGPDTPVWTPGMAEWQPLGVTSGLNAATATASASPVRPTSVTVIGILNIVFGSLNLLCTPLAIVGLMVPQAQGTPLQMGAAMRLYTGVGLVISLIAAVVLLASGIGLLRLKNWARQTAYIYGWFAIVWGLIALVVNGVMLSSSLSGMSEQTAGPVIGGVIGGLCGGVLGLIYPVILVIFMKKDPVIQACRG